MQSLLRKFNYLICAVLLTGMAQEAQAQKESFFNHFHWNKSYYAPAGAAAQGFDLNTLYRNYNDTTNRYLSLAFPVQEINSAFGFYYLHNTSNHEQNLQSGLSYTAFLSVGEESSLHLGIQANRQQRALSEKAWTFGEYQTDYVTYTAGASLFFQRGKLNLGLSAEDLYRQGSLQAPAYSLLLGFRELRTNEWLHSSPYLLMRSRPGQELPEWRFNYSATIADFLVLGSSYYKNSSYLYGFNAGLKVCNSLWLTAATDFENLLLPYRALYEFGLRLHIAKKKPAAPPTPEVKKPRTPEVKEYEGF